MIFNYKRWGVIAAMLASFVFSAHAAAQTYSIQSSLYGDIPGGTLEGTFLGTMSYSGSVTVNAPFAPNLTDFDFSGMVTSYTLSNGVDTLTEANSVVYPGEAVVSTDGSGEVTRILFAAISPPPPHSPGTVGDFTAFRFDNDTGLGRFEGTDNFECSDVDGGTNLCVDAVPDSPTGQVDKEEPAVLNAPPSSPSPSQVRGIPALPVWGLLLLASGLTLLGGSRLRRGS